MSRGGRAELLIFVKVAGARLGRLSSFDIGR
jgi:hypothetical protein